MLGADKVFGVDLLKWNPDEAFPDGAPFIVAGNFPYNISSQILFRVLDWRDRVPECVGMFQKRWPNAWPRVLAQRLTAF